MSKVIKMAPYRKKKRQKYLRDHGEKLDALLMQFLDSHLNVNFNVIAEHYLSHRLDHNEADWDYLDFREMLSAAFKDSYADLLIAELGKTHWYDARSVSTEAVLDRFLSLFILGDQYAKIS